MKILLPCSFLIMLLPSCSPNLAKEEAAIRAVLEKESATWRSGDEKGHASCWLVQPYSKILVSTPGGQCFDVPVTNMIHPPAGSMGKGGHAENSNYQMCIRDNIAWVSHDEISTAADGTKSYSHEIRLLEKSKGEWKLTGQSIHLYNPR